MGCCEQTPTTFVVAVAIEVLGIIFCILCAVITYNPAHDIYKDFLGNGDLWVMEFFRFAFIFIPAVAGQIFDAVFLCVNFLIIGIFNQGERKRRRSVFWASMSEKTSCLSTMIYAYVALIVQMGALIALTYFHGKVLAQKRLCKDLKDGTLVVLLPKLVSVQSYAETSDSDKISLVCDHLDKISNGVRVGEAGIFCFVVGLVLFLTRCEVYYAVLKEESS